MRRREHITRYDGVRGRTLFRNASDFIPLPMIPLTELVVGNASGRADFARRCQMKADGDSALTFVTGKRTAFSARPFRFDLHVDATQSRNCESKF